MTSGNKASLTVREGPQRGRLFELATPATVGRSKSCNVAVEDADASRVHLVVEYEANEYTVRDNGSANGTFLNGRRVNVAALRHGDLITLGGTTLLFQIGFATRSAGGRVAASMQIKLGEPPFASVTKESGLAEVDAALQKYKVLFQANELIAHLPLGDGFFQLVLEHLLQILNADRGLVLLGSTEDSLEIAARLSRHSHVDLQPISTTLLKRVMADGEALLVKDALLDDRLLSSDSVLSAGSRSILCAPLRANDATLGVIQIESHGRAAAFSEGDLQLVAALARQAGVALSHGKLEEARTEAVDRATLRRFLDAATTEKVLTQRPDWKKGATARLSLLFVDLRPLTAGQIDSLQTVNAILTRATAIVFEHGGVLSRLTPDALLAFWGAPFREREDPRRAVETALDLQSFWRHAGLPAAASLRCALHSGEAFVGEFGSTTRNDFAVLGRDVEDTARFTGHLDPGTIGASPAFYRELSTHLVGDFTSSFLLTNDPTPMRLFVVRGLVV